MTKLHRLPAKVLAAMLAAGLVLSPIAAHGDDSAQSSAERATVAALQSLPPIAPTSDGAYLEDLRSRAAAFASLGRPDLALGTISAVKSDRQSEIQRTIQDEIWRISARRSALEGDIESATHDAARIKNSFSRADALLAIARCRLRHQNPQAARLALYAASPLVRTHPQAGDIQQYIGYLVAKAGDIPGARRLFAVSRARPSSGQSTGGEPEKRMAEQRTFQLLFRAGLGPENLEKLPQNLWIRAGVVDACVRDRNFELAEDVVAKTEALEDRVNLCLDLGSAAAKANRPQDLKRATELETQAAQQVDRLTDGGAKRLTESGQGCVWAWIAVAILQASQGDSRFNQSLDRAYAAFQKQDPKDPSLPWTPTNSSREQFADNFWVTLAVTDLSPHLPNDLRKSSRERAYNVAMRFPEGLRGDLLLGLAANSTPGSEPWSKSNVLAAAWACERSTARLATDVNALQGLSGVARIYLKSGDRDTAAQVVQEIMETKIPNASQQQKATYLAADGFFGPVIGVIQSGQWKDNDSDSLKQVAYWQSTGSAPAPPPGWILNLRDPRHRSGALEGWTAGLIVPRDEKLHAEEEELELSASSFSSRG